MYPLNTWYAAAWDLEVKRELLSRTICGRPVVLYRTVDGAPVALADACWHRLVPLSMGRLCGDDVVCGYHGVTFAPDGRCSAMPAQQTINPAAGVRSYPVVERHRFVWIWPGEPELADPDLVPDLHWNDDPEWTADGSVIHLECDYRLVLDNLMDLTHEQFLHADTLANATLSEADFQTEHDESTVKVIRWMRGIEAPPLLGMQLAKKNPGFSGPVDRWQIIRFTVPSTITIEVGIAPVAARAEFGDRLSGVNGRVMNTVTPAGRGACHYFWSFARDYNLRDQALTHVLTDKHIEVFGQDAEMLEAQQRAIEANPDHDFYNLNIDAGGMWARRLIDVRVAAENARAPMDPADLAKVTTMMRGGS